MKTLESPRAEVAESDLRHYSSRTMERIRFSLLIKERISTISHDIEEGQEEELDEEKGFGLRFTWAWGRGRRRRRRRGLGLRAAFLSRRFLEREALDPVQQH